MEQRFYFKLADGKAWWNLKTPVKPHEDAISITKEEWDAHIAELEAAAKEAQEGGK